MPANNWSHVRLAVQLHPSAGEEERSCLHWRLEAKAPGDEWTLRSTVGFGQALVHGQPWPPSRDDMLAAMVELLMAARWTAEGVVLE